MNKYNQPAREVQPLTSFATCANCRSSEGVKAFSFTTFNSQDGRQSSQQTLHYCESCALNVAATLAFAFAHPGINRVEIFRTVDFSAKGYEE